MYREKGWHDFWQKSGFQYHFWFWKKTVQISRILLINASHLVSYVIVRKPFETSEVELTTVRMTTSGFFGSNNHIIKIELGSSCALGACNRSPMTPNNNLLLTRSWCSLSFTCKQHGILKTRGAPEGDCVFDSSHTNIADTSPGEVVTHSGETMAYFFTPG